MSNNSYALDDDALTCESETGRCSDVARGVEWTGNAVVGLRHPGASWRVLDSGGVLVVHGDLLSRRAGTYK